MNNKQLSRHGLKFDPFSPAIPTEAIHLVPTVEHFFWRVETQLVPGGGFALITGDPGTGESVTHCAYSPSGSSVCAMSVSAY